MSHSKTIIYIKEKPGYTLWPYCMVVNRSPMYLLLSDLLKFEMNWDWSEKKYFLSHSKSCSIKSMLLETILGKTWKIFVGTIYFHTFFCIILYQLWLELHIYNTLLWQRQKQKISWHITNYKVISTLSGNKNSNTHRLDGLLKQISTVSYIYWKFSITMSDKRKLILVMLL